MDFDPEVNDSGESVEHSANPGYALGQLINAYNTSQTHKDPETRARAVKKIEGWLTVLRGMLTGALKIGSRTPKADTPAWVTLEVFKGGFTTGAMLAGGSIQPHEEALLEKLSITSSGSKRTAINDFFLSDEGFPYLRQMLVDGTYRVQVPEEGALLVVAWLLENERVEEAQAIIEEIGPYFSALRFYPVPATHPVAETSTVHLQDVGETISRLEDACDPYEIEAQREAIQVWTPLYDRTVSLFVETVVNDWPCQHYPDGWKVRAKAVLDQYKKARSEHLLCHKPDDKRQNFAILRTYLRQCIDDPRKLSGLDVARIRRILKSIDAKRGLPGSERCQLLREWQVKQVSKPTNVQWSRILITRLRQFPKDRGLASLDVAVNPLTKEEAESIGVEVGNQLPERFLVKLRLCVEAPLDELIETGVVSSGETLARLVLQISSQVFASGIADVPLRRLYSYIYQAFRKRRSFLLLNLESQVKIHELPWIKAIAPYKNSDESTEEQALQMLKHVVTLVIRNFPYQIVPNKLLKEIRSLANSAGLKMPVIDELASDIFMNEFTENYLRAAQKAGELLKGTLYERYYRIPYDRIQQIEDIKPSRYKTPTSQEFGKLCCELAGETNPERFRSPANNGKIIEQQQIVTTQNLAVLFGGLDLTTTLEPELSEIARKCFTWICREQQRKIMGYRPQLRMVKNTAYAWRQMVFFLSLLPIYDIQEFLGWANNHLKDQPKEYRSRFQPALDGLVSAAESLRSGVQEDKWQPFLGWTSEKHWLMP